MLAMDSDRADRVGHRIAEIVPGRRSQRSVRRSDSLRRWDPAWTTAAPEVVHHPLGSSGAGRITGVLAGPASLLENI